ncbi:MAG: heme exporter protein CcmD [Rhizobiaceae bacterium]|jgi:hypothetical protein|nr:heme exporter protein CcmD [Rhizobiaceae bacterium]
MDSLPEHFEFVAASYAVSLVALGGLAAVIIIGARRARARVEALERGASSRAVDTGADRT